LSKENRLPAKTRVVGGTGQGLQRVYISKEVYKDIFNFSKDKNVVQAGGILLGNKLRKGETHYYIIRAFIEAKHCEATSNSIKFTKDTIKYIEQVKKNYPSYKIIGWMHTNPDTGCNATEYDEYFQTRTFEGKNIIEYIVDPVQIVEAFYYMENGKMKKIDGFFIFTDDESKKKEKRIIPEISEPVQKESETEEIAEVSNEVSAEVSAEVAEADSVSAANESETDSVESPDEAVAEDVAEALEEQSDEVAQDEEVAESPVEEAPMGEDVAREDETEESAVEEGATESVEEPEEEITAESVEEPEEEITTESVEEPEEEITAESAEEPITDEFAEEEPVVSSEEVAAEVLAEEEYPEVEIPMVEAYDVDAHSNASEDYQDESDSKETEEYESYYDSDNQSQDYIDEIAQAFEENYNIETSNEDTDEESNREASEEASESDINGEVALGMDEKAEQRPNTPFIVDDTVPAGSVEDNDRSDNNLREEITLEEVKNTHVNELEKVFEESEKKIEESDSVNYIYPEEQEEYREDTKGLKRFVGILTALLILSLGVVVVLFWKVNSLNNYINSMQGYVNGLHSEIDKLHTDVESLNGVAETLYENDVNLTNIINGETTAAETTAEETKAQETAVDENSEDNKKEDDKNDNKDDNNDDNKDDNNDDNKDDNKEDNN
jgi:hypothetical protein